MTTIIYSNNDVTISIESINEWETKVNINGENLMWIARETQEDFMKKLTSLLNEYRI